MEPSLSPRMTSIEGAERLPDADYSIPHRTAPPVPSSNSSDISALPSRPNSTAHHHARHASDVSIANSHRISNSSAGSAGSFRRKREGSFGILRRGRNNSRDIIISAPIAPVQEDPSAPSQSSPSHSPTRRTPARPPHDILEEEGHTTQMFRSRSRHKKEAEAVTQQHQLPPPPEPPINHSPPLPQQPQHSQQYNLPHRFPPNHPLAGLQPPNGVSFEQRPDSIALFSQGSYPSSPSAHTFRAPLHKYPQSSPPPKLPPPPPPPPGPPPAANFSRPGMPASAYNNKPQHSSSPAYAIRQGNAFAAQASSSPSVIGSTSSREYVDNQIEQPSMANRGRFNSVSTVATTINVNSPRRIRRRKDPTAFNILVIGAKNSGKSSFISFLRHSLDTPVKRTSQFSDSSSHIQTSSNSSFIPQYVETDLDGERVAVTLWDSPGLEKSIVDLQMREMITFVESKFEETFSEEQKVSRTPGVRDTHIHCVFVLLDPSRLDLTVNSSKATHNAPGDFAQDVALDNAMDLQVIQALWGKTAVIPVIAKADTVTSDHMAFLKRAVWANLKAAKLDPVAALDMDDDDEEDEESDNSQPGTFLDINGDDDSDSGNDELPQARSKASSHNRNSSIMASIPSSANEATPYIPMSILSPDPSELSAQASKKEKVGRRFPWGFADPNDPEHCDFSRLRDTFFNEWRVELRDLARSKWYEHWRTSRLKNMPASKTRQHRVFSNTSSNAPIAHETRSNASTMSPQMSPNMMQPEEFTSNIHTAGVAIAPAAMATVPRTVMNGAPPMPNNAVNAGGALGPGRSTSKAERMMGISPAEARGIRGPQATGGTYRGVETYQQ